MNKLNMRLAKIAFNVLRAEEVAKKHWKTDEEVYSVSKWQRYLDKAKKRPKVHPTVVPDKKWGEAKKLKEKMQEEGATWEEWQDAVEKKFSPKKLKRENVYKTFGVDKKWDGIEKNKKQEAEKKQKSEESREKRNERKREKRKEHREEYSKHHNGKTFSFGGETYDKVDTFFDDQDVEEEFNEIFHVKVGTKKPKKLLTTENEDVLKNQLCQFHKERKGNWRIRSDAQLLGEFIRRMDPSAYSDIKEFKAARDRMIELQRKDPHLGMEIVHHIWEKQKNPNQSTTPGTGTGLNEDDEEENMIVEEPKEKSFEDEMSEIKYN